MHRPLFFIREYFVCFCITRTQIGSPQSRQLAAGMPQGARIDRS